MVSFIEIDSVVSAFQREQTDTHTDRHTHRHTDRHADRHTDRREEGKGEGGKREEGGGEEGVGEEGGEGKLLRDGRESKALQTVFADLKTVNKGTI